MRTETEAELATQAASSRIYALVQPVRQGRHRLLITTRGLARVEIEDRFDEVVVDLHWLTILKWFVDDDDSDLQKFSGFQVAGHRLASSAFEIGACFRWVAL